MQGHCLNEMGLPSILIAYSTNSRINSPTEMAESAALAEGAMLPYTGPGVAPSPAPAAPSGALVLPRKAPAMPKPKWHAPWKLFRVISGHLGWVRCVTVEPGNEWFATGEFDRFLVKKGTLEVLEPII